MNVPTTEPAIRIAKLFKRKPQTGWGPKEVKQYRLLVKMGCFDSLEDLSLVERYYEHERKKGDKGFHRRHLDTFLNNWWGELDKARAWGKRSEFWRTNKYKSRGTAFNGEKPLGDDEFQAVGELVKNQLAAFRESLKMRAPGVQT